MMNQKRELQGRLRQLSKHNYVSQHADLLEKVTALEDNIRQDRYKILVLGEFKRGKSTLVNALLGRSILPMDVLPETATLNEIVYKIKKYSIDKKLKNMTDINNLQNLMIEKNKLQNREKMHISLKDG